MHAAPRPAHREHAGRARSHRALAVVHALQAFCRTDVFGSSVHFFACLMRDDSGRMGGQRSTCLVCWGGVFCYQYGHVLD
jgi:hypothetical protein